MNIFRFENVHLSFGEQEVLRVFNLTVAKGEKVLIYGDSGTGKSSILRMALGFVVPHAGRVTIDGELLTPHLAWQVRRRCAYVPQASDLGDGTAAEIIAWIRTVRSNRGRTRELSQELTTRLRLEPAMLTKQLSDLSGGERQRIAIAAALTLDRSVFLLDEATASLDATLKGSVVQLFATQPDWTVVAVSHDPAWRDSGKFRVVNLDTGVEDGK